MSSRYFVTTVQHRYRQGTIDHSDTVISEFMTTKESEEKFVAADIVQRLLVRSH